jgi:hypothetical protein
MLAMRRYLGIRLLFVAIVVVAVVGALAQLARGKRPVLFASS